MNYGFDYEICHTESEFYYPDEDFRHFRSFHSNPVGKKIHILFAGLGRSVLEKPAPEVSSMARGRRPSAIPDTQGLYGRRMRKETYIHMYLIYKLEFKHQIVEPSCAVLTRRIAACTQALIIKNKFVSRKIRRATPFEKAQDLLVWVYRERCAFVCAFV